MAKPLRFRVAQPAAVLRPVEILHQLRYSLFVGSPEAPIPVEENLTPFSLIAQFSSFGYRIRGRYYAKGNLSCLIKALSVGYGSWRELKAAYETTGHYCPPGTTAHWKTWYKYYDEARAHLKGDTYIHCLSARPFSARAEFSNRTLVRPERINYFRHVKIRKTPALSALFEEAILNFFRGQVSILLKELGLRPFNLF